MIVDLAIIGTDNHYEFLFMELENYAEAGDTENVFKKKQEIFKEIQKSMQSAVQRITSDILKDLYNSNYSLLKCDMAKLALLNGKGTDDKSPSDRIKMLSLIWDKVAYYYEHDPEEFVKRVEFPIRGKYL